MRFASEWFASSDSTESWQRRAEMTAIGQNGLGWNLAASVGDDYVQKDGLWVMHGYYSRVHDYYEPITYWAGNSYFGGYSNMHGCSDESCGDAYHRQILYDFYVPSTTVRQLGDGTVKALFSEPTGEEPDDDEEEDIG